MSWSSFFRPAKEFYAVKWNMSWFADLSLIPKDIKFVIVFGFHEKHVIYLTKEDTAYGFGSNLFDLLGNAVSHFHEATPTIIPNLCHKRVCDIVNGARHAVALTEDGNILTWGDNQMNQLGLGDIPNCRLPVPIPALKGHRVVQVACGKNHSLALTDTSQVFGWGDNDYGQLGCGNVTKTNFPAAVQGLSAYSPVKIVQCGSYTSFALVHDGDLLGWGDNDDFQFGGQYKDCVNRPVRMRTNARFKSISCGSHHIIALRVDQKACWWGWGNNILSMDLEIQEPAVPMDIAIPEDKVIVEVASHVQSCLSAILTDKGEIFVVGITRYGPVIPAKPTTFASLQDVFTCFFQTPVSHRTMTSPYEMTIPGDDNDCEDLRSVLAENFNNESTSDMTFLVGGQSLYGHASFLRMRSAYLNAFMKWTSSRSEMEITGYSYSAFRCYLRFLYTDCLTVEEADVIEVLKLSNEYVERQLFKLCEMSVAAKITDENAADTYALADQLNSEVLKRQAERIMRNQSIE